MGDACTENIMWAFVVSKSFLLIFHLLICHGNSLLEFMERKYFIMDHQENITFGIAEFFRTGQVIEGIHITTCTDCNFNVFCLDGLTALDDLQITDSGIQEAPWIHHWSRDIRSSVQT